MAKTTELMRLPFLLLTALVATASSVAAQVQLRSTPVGPRSEPLPPPRAEAIAPRAVAVLPRAMPAIPVPRSGGSEQTTATLRAGDTFEVRLSGMDAPYGDDFMRQYLVDPDGSVNFPYIDAVRAAGYTPGQLEKVIQQKLVVAKIFTHPTVNITTQSTARVVAVTGGVRAPQRLPWTADLTLRTSVDLAGGMGDFASPKGVRLIRAGKVIGVYDLRKLQKDPALDPKVLPGDQVDVPQ